LQAPQLNNPESDAWLVNGFSYFSSTFFFNLLVLVLDVWDVNGPLYVSATCFKPLLLSHPPVYKSCLCLDLTLIFGFVVVAKTNAPYFTIASSCLCGLFASFSIHSFDSSSSKR
jgi:hypothetical protein